MFFSIASSTTSRRRIDDSPEYPKIKRTWTRGLPPQKAHCQKRVPVTGLEERTAPAYERNSAHGPDQVPLIPWLPLTLEPREDEKMMKIKKSWTASTAAPAKRTRYSR